MIPVQRSGSPPARRVMSRPPGPSAERGTFASRSVQRERGRHRLGQVASPRHLLVVRRPRRAPPRRRAASARTTRPVAAPARRRRAGTEEHARFVEQRRARCAPSRAMAPGERMRADVARAEPRGLRRGDDAALRARHVHDQRRRPRVGCPSASAASPSSPPASRARRRPPARFPRACRPSPRARCLPSPPRPASRASRS